METTFLKYFITEDLYLIHETQETPTTDTIVEEPVVEYHETVKPPLSDTCVVLNDVGLKDNEMLGKLLTAIKVSNPDYTNQLDFESGHKNYLIFGDYFTKEEKYIIHEVDGVRMLVSDEIAILEREESLKRKLWTALQKMFL